MAIKLPMGQRELLRGKMMEMVSEGTLTLKEACVRLRVSAATRQRSWRRCRRQAIRIYRRYREGGDAGLIHRSQGKPSNRKAAAGFRAQVVTAYRERYNDFGPTFAAEKMAEAEGRKVAVETLRVWLMEEGLWERKRSRLEKPRNPYRSRRDRRECFGERGNAPTSLASPAMLVPLPCNSTGRQRSCRVTMTGLKEGVRNAA